MRSVHTRAGRTASLTFRVERVGEHVSEGQPPLTEARDYHGVATVGRRCHDLPPVLRPEDHLGESDRGRAHDAGADHHGTGSRRPYIRVEDTAWREVTIDGYESSTADRQVVKDVRIQVIRQVSHGCLDMRVIGRGVLGGRAGTVQQQMVSLLHYRQRGRAY